MIRKLFLSVILALPAFGQSTLATLQGTVRDASRQSRRWIVLLGLA